MTGEKSVAGSNESLYRLGLIREGADVCEQQGITIGRTLRHHICAQIAVSAGLIFDNNRLAERVAQFLSDRARQNVGPAAGAGRAR